MPILTLIIAGSGILALLPTILIVLLILAIFFTAAYFILGKVPEPYRGWAIAVGVVVVAIIAIIWLLGLLQHGTLSP